MQRHQPRNSAQAVHDMSNQTSSNEPEAAEVSELLRTMPLYREEITGMTSCDGPLFAGQHTFHHHDDVKALLLRLRSRPVAEVKWLRLGKLSIAERPDGETYVLESEALEMLRTRPVSAGENNG
jgi:hypothetical protein